MINIGNVMCSPFVFMASIWRMPWYWRIWIVALMVLNGIVPFLYLEFVEAKVVISVFILAAITQMIIYYQKGFVRLLGIGHFYWFPLLVWLFMRNSGGHLTDDIIIWISLLFLFNIVSLLIDMVDLIRYWRGERSPTILL